ncbi:uncharacterized protein TrAtP1_007756 [Trichoderma atroviride]|uniref:uncharacterized protein n=1 Tax=Hypocrea atroviridis TaxID=63577 RepID=UPI003321502E|nr:hypothetical protein TrAtP1_007756 [Trichoderma atroviride]
MSEVISRPSASRGRGSGRGGRGGFAGRGGRRSNGENFKADDNLGTFEDEGEFAELRKQYGDKTLVIREMFPDWSEPDVLYALKETNGDETEAVTRMAEGTISQWGEVSKKTKTARTKAKDTSSAPANTELSSSARNTRGGRASDGAPRGGRGRATDRGGRGGRARSTHPTNGSRPKDGQQLSVPTEESPAYKDDAANGLEEKIPVVAETAAVAEPAKAAVPPVKTWASMLRQSIPPPKIVPAVPKEVAAPKPVEHVEPEHAPEPAPIEAEPVKPEAEENAENTPVAEQATPVAAPAATEPAAIIAPSQDELTETNLEQVVDVSQPPATDTAASTAADSWDPRQSPPSATATPLSAAQQQHQAQKTTSSGYAATALKATTERVAPRTPSFQRRVLQQEEAVRMPGNREVDRAAVQFGAFNLDDDEDIDGEREEPETRAQPPADSPVAIPRTSLPPASQPVAVPETYAPKATTAPPSRNDTYCCCSHFSPGSYLLSDSTSHP